MCGLARILCLLGTMALLLPLGYFGESVEGGDLMETEYRDFYGNASAPPRLLRFRDFEPREPRNVVFIAEEAPLPGLEREGRGFHFHASGEDVSVELEFIVPFLKVPVKRSMNLARDAVQNLLNLRTGTILNTAVVVAAGAVIAAVVRLLLAPLVFTSLAGNGYGYKSEPGRGMRRLTDVVESQLEEHNIDMTVCAQQLICQYLQRNLSSGYARVVNVLAGTSWLHSFVHETAVFQAIQSARSSRSCSHTYRSCRWPKRLNWTSGSLPQILKFFNG